MVYCPQRQESELVVAKILLVDDDHQVAEILEQFMQREGHVFEVATTGEDGLQMMKVFEFDVILLDWSLPGISGLEVCQQYRRAGGSTYIIFLTGQNDIDSREGGLDAGGDDYITKPFEFRDLAARIRTVLRRPSSLLTTELSIDGLNLDPKSRTVTVEEKIVHLMPKESALLEYLMRHPNTNFDSQALLDAVWPSDSEASKETVRTWMRNLRNKLKTVGKESFVKTVLGSGYIVELNKTEKKLR
jgi:Response regulators consisting of a CheY-like receiver domain and a winged-helix DNA-binding domain